MIRKVKIENFKSIQELEIELGRFNVFIGENGSGKSNILEAIALGGLAADNKLDDEFLASRGVRVTEAKMMRAAFEKKNIMKEIKLTFENTDQTEWKAVLANTKKRYAKWVNLEDERIIQKEEKARIKEISIGIYEKLKEDYPGVTMAYTDDVVSKMTKSKKFQQRLEGLLQEAITKATDDKLNKTAIIRQFLIFSPENTALRNLPPEERIRPLGIKGEGLFELLKGFSAKELGEVKENLEFIDWFSDFELLQGAFIGAHTLKIKDRFIDQKITFDQRNANEGFLFLLFYFALFISKDTPKFFAIDNIETALNPKLCWKLMEVLNKLSKEHDKQVIFTTHHPAILDGINLNDDEQRLFVIRRNADGHTRADRIVNKPLPTGYESIKLSELFMKGFIGGLPKNF